MNWRKEIFSHLEDMKSDLFEGFCVELLRRSGYPFLRKNGITGDRGVDAYYIEDDQINMTICAFTQQKRNWKKKLQNDCCKIQFHEFKPKKVIFICLAQIRLHERLKKEEDVFRTFGWHLSLIDKEDIYCLLTGKAYDLLKSSSFPESISANIPQLDGWETPEERKKLIEEATFLPIVMAGGVGARVIHLSPSRTQKQFWKLYGRDSMLQDIIYRLEKIEKVKKQKIKILSVKSIDEQIRKQAQRFIDDGSVDLWFEPDRKGTATAIVYSILRARDEKIVTDDSVVGFFPADQYIYDPNDEYGIEAQAQAMELFHETVYKAIDTAKSTDAIVLIGTPVAFPVNNSELGCYPGLKYGWIKTMSNKNQMENDVKKVLDYLEKPNEDLLEGLFDEWKSGANFFWNSGIFFGRVSVFLDCFRRFIPGTYKQILIRKGVGPFGHRCSYKNVRRIKMFDDAVLENVIDSGSEYKVGIYIVQANYEWEDMGHESTIREHFDRRRRNCKETPVDASSGIGEVQIQLDSFEDGGTTYVVHFKDDKVQVATLVTKELEKRHDA